ncbi:MAG: hypothetical protein WEC59_13210, partial [Salibacteraceae bacterium]
FVGIIYALFVMLVLGTVVQVWLLKTPLPQDRTASHFYVLMVIATVFAADAQKSGIKNLVFGFSVLVTGGFVMESIKLRSSLWDQEVVPQSFVTCVKNETASAPNPSTVATTLFIDDVWKYYNVLNDQAIITQHINKSEKISGFDFLIMEKTDRKPEGYETIDQTRKVVLLRSKAFDWQLDSNRRVLKTGVLQEEYLNLFHKSDISNDKVEKVVTSLSIEPPLEGKRLFLIFVEWVGKTERYRQINLYDYSTSKAFLGEEDFQFSRIYDHETSRAKVYLWNPDRLAIHIQRGEVSYFSMKNKRESLTMLNDSL